MSSDWCGPVPRARALIDTEQLASYGIKGSFPVKIIHSYFEMEYIVDVQGFKSSNNQFIFKEVAVIALEEDVTPSVFLFEPPFDWKYLSMKHKSENQWLERNFLGISWSSGDVPYTEIYNVLRTILDDAEKIYVKGLEKKGWLRNILPDKIINNLEDLDCPSLKNLPREFVSCTHHRLCWRSTCAVQNAYILKSWMLKFRKRSIVPPIDDGMDEVDNVLTNYNISAKWLTMYN